jgi:hypothetical protein
MTNEEREALVAHWLESALDEAEDFRALGGPFSDSDRHTKWLILSDLFDEASEGLISCDYWKIEKEADELLRAAGLPMLDHDSADFGRLCRRVLQAKQEYFRIEDERWDGVYKDAPRIRVRFNSAAEAWEAWSEYTPHPGRPDC